MIYTLDEIDNMVNDYKNTTSQEALGKLMEAFNPYLTKWVNIIKCRHMNVSDTEVASFIGLFGCSNMLDLRSMLINTFRYMSGEEVYHELLVLFIYTILRYKKIGGGYFPGYLKNTFKYSVYRWVNGNVRQASQVTCIPGNISSSSNDNEILLDPNILPCLSSKEKMILYMRYIDDKSIEDIANTYKCTTSNINRIIRGAKKKLEDYVR